MEPRAPTRGIFTWYAVRIGARLARSEVAMVAEIAPRYPHPHMLAFCPACILPLDFTPMHTGFAQCTACGWRGVLACPDCGAAFSHAGPWIYWCSVEHGADPVHPGRGTFRAALVATRCAVPL